MSASVIDRLSNNLGHNGVFSGPVVNQTLPNRRNEAMERISKLARRLRGNASPTNALVLAQVGRNDSLEALITRMGVIPVVTVPDTNSPITVLPTVTYPATTSLTGSIQAPAGRRPAATETVSVAGPTAAAVFAPVGPMVAAAFAAGGANQALTATDSIDAAAKGRALITVAP